jgi:Family of unknown function (DUF6515)
MKSSIKILLAACLTLGIFSAAEAQRDRSGGDRSGGESRGGGGSRGNNSFSQRGGGEGAGRPNVSEVRGDRGNFGNRYSAPANTNRYSAPANIQRNDRQIVNNRENITRNVQPRNEIARTGVRENRDNFDRANRGTAGRFDRGNSRYNNYSYNNRYSNGYRYNNGYRTGYNRGFSFAYGPRYSIIPRNHISINFGGNPYYFYNGFYYGYYGGYYEPIFPPIGLRIGFLPFGCSSLFIGGYPYYYNNGIYYRPYDDNNYEVVDPPMGATVSSLPKGAKSVVLNGEKLYELNGTYYKEGRNSKDQVLYTVVGKNGEINNSDDDTGSIAPGNNDVAAPPASLQMGDIISQLPEGSKTVTIGGEKLYVAPDDTYLKEESDGGVVQYKVVGVAK